MDEQPQKQQAAAERRPKQLTYAEYRAITEVLMSKMVEIEDLPSPANEISEDELVQWYLEKLEDQIDGRELLSASGLDVGVGTERPWVRIPEVMVFISEKCFSSIYEGFPM